jgi:hypothetical protein
MRSLQSWELIWEELKVDKDALCIPQGNTKDHATKYYFSRWDKMASQAEYKQIGVVESEPQSFDNSCPTPSHE